MNVIEVKDNILISWYEYHYFKKPFAFMQKYNAFLSSVNETEELYMALSSSYSQINWAIKSATKNTFLLLLRPKTFLLFPIVL